MAAAANVFEKSIALSLEIGRIGIRKKVGKGKMVLREGEGAQPEQDAIGVSKELIDCQEYDAIVKLDSAIRADLSRYSVPSRVTRRGIYLIPVTLVQRVDDMISRYKLERDALVTAFLTAYSDSVSAARDRLGGLWNGDDYSAKEDVRDAFTVTSEYISLGIPQALGTIDKAIFERERQAFEAKVTSAAEEIQMAMRESFKELVEHMTERLKPGEDGKPRIFRDTLVSNLKDFMDTFAARNIADDAELETLVSKARAILDGKDAQQLRDDTFLRNTTREGMETIKAQLDTMVTTAPIRKFSFDDETPSEPAAAA